MVQRVTIKLVDDLDGGEADETITFAMDGFTYQIDLSSEHADQFRGFVCHWARAARRVDHQSGRGAAKLTAPVDQQEDRDVRAWARRAGIPVDDSK